jgi:hypothetical protein
MFYTKESGSFTIPGQNTFFMGGVQYSVVVARICTWKQQGLSSKSSDPIAELYIWGIPTATTQKKTIAAFIIPIFQDVVQSTAGDSLITALKGEAVSLDGFIPGGKSVQVMRYTSCIETDIDFTLSIDVAYWSAGLTIKQDNVKLIPMPLAPFGIPRVSDYKVLTSFSLTATGKGDRIYTVKNSIMTPYSNPILTVASPDFRNGFRLIDGFIGFDGHSVNQDTSAYKCVAIDRNRDIKNGKLLIDPSTGKKLSDVNDDANTVENEGSLGNTSAKPGNVMEYMAIAIGTILGLFLLCLAAYYMYKFLVDRQSQGLDPVSGPVCLPPELQGPGSAASNVPPPPQPLASPRATASPASARAP